MKILLRSVEVVQPHSELHGKRKNILIENGYITSISDNELVGDKVIKGEDLKVSVGWFDMNCRVGDPGYEHKENIASLAKAALAGGFTGVACLPSTKPVIQTKDVITYIRTKASEQLIDVYPMGAVTIGLKGEEISEMIDLHTGGAVAFTDGDKPIWHSDVFLKSLQYLQKFDGLLIQRPDDRYLSAYGQMNEGRNSTVLGLKGIPAISEELIVQRDLRILEYTGGKLHFSQISTPGALQLIKDAKKKGLQVTCDMASYHFALDDSELASFDTALKVLPPLRGKKDVDFFKKAYKEGVVDVIVSAHRPEDKESKNLEYDLAEPGMINLETSFSLMLSSIRDIDIQSLIEKIAYNPRKLLKIPVPEIKIGAKAELTIFNTQAEWTYTTKSLRSRSDNSPFFGKKLKGKVIAVVNKGKVVEHTNV